ncbi:MAG: tRNA (adenosine(37)-N6)-threonylcarbamoyltransferase complex dimerization subunit type 1 TsaB [Microgenomates group bacterium]|jgi:tRNA threonylcarbamoyladenosine biosynthesis protein TsaB
MILHINTKDSKLITVALKDKNKVVGEMSEENEYGSQVLLPLITKLLKKEDLEFKDLTEVEVEEGPGSFTGLRVGATVAQALGFALNIPVNGKLNSPVKLKYT